MTINIEKTKNPKTKPADADLKFGKYFTDHMLVMDYEEGRGWYQASIEPYRPLELDPAAMVLHYGQAVFEGMKCYRDSQGKLRLFRPRKNFERLNASSERLCIPALDVDFVLDALIKLINLDADWVPSAEGTSLYIRPFIIATEAALGVHVSKHYQFIVILSPVGAYYPGGMSPVKICIENEYVRAVRGGLGFTKASANYASSLKGQIRAEGMGYTQVLWLDGIDRKFIEEVGTMNVFFKIKNEIITPALEGSILPGITRDSVINLLKDWGYTVSERKISIFELYEAQEKGWLDEAFGTGTAAVISPIGEFNWDGNKIQVSKGQTGPLAKRLYDELTGIQYGKLEDRFGWVKAVEE